MQKKRPIGNIQYLGDDKYFLRFSAGFDDYGKRIQLSKTVICKNEKEAEIELMKFYSEKDKLLEEKTNETPERLCDLYKEWTKNHVSKKAIRTQSFYEGLWENHVKDKSKIKLKTMLPKHIFEIIENVDGDRTRQATFKMLKAMLNKGVQWGYLESNPCNRIETPKYEAEEKRGLTKEEIQFVFKYLPDEELKYQAATMLAILCGLRRQEIVGLKWDNIVFKKNIIEIKQAATSKKGEGTIESKTKTKKSVRTLRLPQQVKPILAQMKMEQKLQKNKLENKWIDEDWVFTQWNGKLLNLTTISAWWHDFADKIGIEGVTFHGLRHTAASYLISSGVDIITTAEILGHAKPSTTMNIYGHLIKDSKEAAMETLENVISLNKKASQKTKSVI